jgi:hypothetical protein
MYISKFWQLSTLFWYIENGERGDKEAATSSSVAMGIPFPAGELRGGPDALQAAPAESWGESTYCERGRVLLEGQMKRRGLLLPRVDYPPLVSCAPCAPLLSLWGGLEGLGSTFRDGGDGRGHVQSSVHP